MAGDEFDFGALVEEAEAGAGADRDVLGALLDATDDDPDAERRQALADADITDLGSEFDTIAALTRRRDELQGRLDEVKRDLEAAKGRMLDAMETQGTSQFRSAEGLGSCYVQERFDTTLDDPDAFMEWVKERAPELLSVNAQTRNKYVRVEFRDKGVDPDSGEFPPGVKVTPRKQLAVRGAKAKGGRSKEKAK